METRSERSGRSYHSNKRLDRRDSKYDGSEKRQKSTTDDKFESLKHEIASKCRRYDYDIRKIGKSIDTDNTGEIKEQQFEDLVLKDLKFKASGKEIQQLIDYYGKRAHKGYVNYKKFDYDIYEINKKKKREKDNRESRKDINEGSVKGRREEPRQDNRQSEDRRRGDPREGTRHSDLRSEYSKDGARRSEARDDNRRSGTRGEYSRDGVRRRDTRGDYRDYDEEGRNEDRRSLGKIGRGGSSKDVRGASRNEDRRPPRRDGRGGSSRDVRGASRKRAERDRQDDLPEEGREETKTKEEPMSVHPSPNMPSDSRYSMRNTVVGRYPESRKQKKHKVAISDSILQDIIKATY